MIRRDFLRAAGLAAAGLAIEPRLVWGELSSSDFGSRIARARELMRGAKIDLLFAVPSKNMAYLSKLNTFRSERLTALLLPLEGEPAIVCPAFEEERMRRSSAFNRMETWQESEDPYQLAAGLFKKMNASRVGMEPSTDCSTYWKLRE